VSRQQRSESPYLWAQEGTRLDFWLNHEDVSQYLQAAGEVHPHAVHYRVVKGSSVASRWFDKRLWGGL
jgi:hypothetical protein